MQIPVSYTHLDVYKRQAPAYADILEALKAFFLNGHRIYVMHGNRDFLLGKGFTAATGAQLIADPIPVQVGFDHIPGLLYTSRCV